MMQTDSLRYRPALSERILKLEKKRVLDLGQPLRTANIINTLTSGHSLAL